MTGLGLVRLGLERIADYCLPPLFIWIGYQAFFGGSQRFDVEAWWVGLAAFAAWVASPGAGRRLPWSMVVFVLLALGSSAWHHWAFVAASPELPWWEVFRAASHWPVMLIFAVGLAHVLRTPPRMAAFATGLTAATFVVAARLLFDRTRTGFLYNEAGPGSLPSLVQWSGLHQLGVVFVIGLPLTMAIVVYGGRWHAAIAGLVLSASLMLAAFLNGSRSAILSMAIVAMLMLGLPIASGPQPRWLKRLSVVLLLVVPLALGYAFTQHSTSMRSLGSLSAGRLPIWTTALHIIQDNPWLGVGPGRYLVTLVDGGYGERYLPGWGSMGTATHAHNQVLQVAAEAGVPAVVCFLWMWAWMLYACWTRMSDARVRPVAIGILFALLAVLIRSNYDSIVDGIISSDRIRIVVWLLFGAAIALRNQPQERARHDG